MSKQKLEVIIDGAGLSDFCEGDGENSQERTRSLMDAYVNYMQRKLQEELPDYSVSVDYASNGGVDTINGEAISDSEFEDEYLQVCDLMTSQMEWVAEAE